MKGALQSYENYYRKLNMSEILVKAGEKSALRKEFRVSWPTVRNALNGRYTGGISGKIRVRALQRGGVEVQKTNIAK